MVFHFTWKSREIRFDKGWNSVLSQMQLEKWINYQQYFEWHFKPIAANLKWNFVFIQLICRESVVHKVFYITVVGQNIKDPVWCP